MRGDASLLGDARSEIRLDLLLDEMLGQRETEGRPGTMDAPAPIGELRDTARRLRAASQWRPLPEGRLTVRRALLVATQQGPGLLGAGRAAWRRAGMWLSTIAMIAILGAWTLGAEMLDPVPTSSPAHALRLMLDKARLALVPVPARYALSYAFPAARLLAVAGTTKIHGTVGGLPVALSLTTIAGTCSSGTTCGTFTTSVAQLSGAASAKFGTMSGTFGCGADGACTLAFAEMTGVFATIGDPALVVSATGERAGSLTTKVASLNDWVSTVASAGQRLQAEGLLPAGLTVKDLVNAAGTSGTSNDNGGGGGTGESHTHGLQNPTNAGDKRGGGTTDSSSPAASTVGAGVGSAANGGVVQPGPGINSSTPGGLQRTGRGASHPGPAGRDRVHNGSTSGGARGQDRGASRGVGAAGMPAHADGARDRDGDSDQDRESGGGDGGTDHDDHAPNDHSEGVGHPDDQVSTSSGGRGAHGEDHSGGIVLHGGGHGDASGDGKGGGDKGGGKGKDD